MAAQPLVIDSYKKPIETFTTNVLGTANVLNSCIGLDDLRCFISVTTDKVYANKEKLRAFQETDPLGGDDPYSASKAGSDHIVRSFNKTYKLPTLISNCSNNYGPYQSMEKLVPLTIYNSLNHKSIPIYGDGLQVRDWIYVKDHCEALKKILFNGEPGDVYNIGSSKELKNIDIVRKICSILDLIVPIKKNKSYSELISFVEDRPGHDYRYAINSNKIKEKLGWEPKTSFQEGIESTIKWYLNNNDWIQRATGKSFKDWINLQYSQ